MSESDKQLIYNPERLQYLIHKKTHTREGLSEPEDQELGRQLDLWAANYHQRAWQERAQKEGKTIEQVKEDNKKFWRSIIDQSYIGKLKQDSEPGAGGEF